MKATQLPFEGASSFEALPEVAMTTVIDRLAKTDLESAIRHLSEAGIFQIPSPGEYALGLGAPSDRGSGRFVREAPNKALLIVP
jgi:hypothetical protein